MNALMRSIYRLLNASMRSKLPILAALMISFVSQGFANSQFSVHEKYITHTKEQKAIHEMFLMYKPWGVLLEAENSPIKDAWQLQPHPSRLPIVHITTGWISPESMDEARFVIAHELAHWLLRHQNKMEARILKVAKNELTLSGMIFLTFGKKFEEREADDLGKKLYIWRGGDPKFFSEKYRELKGGIKIMSSLSFSDTHFGMEDRFKRLADE
jgi:Zn-dependent protease with chaperone function